jgi:hypothetical protein
VKIFLVTLKLAVKFSCRVPVLKPLMHGLDAMAESPLLIPATLLQAAYDS